MTHSEQLEREVEHNRAQVAHTLDELRSQVSFGEIVDQALSYAGNGNAADFARNLGRQVSANPLPLVMVAAGLAWLMVAKREPVAAPTLNPPASGQNGGGLGHRLSEAGSVLKDKVLDTSTSVGNTMASAASMADDTVSSAVDTLRGTTATIKHSAASLRRRAAAAGGGVQEFCVEHPLVLIGAGLSIGAALGAALPGTRIESELMSEQSEDVIRKAKAYAADKVKTATGPAGGTDASSSIALTPAGSPLEPAREARLEPQNAG